jgi:2,3,4,5-tetrahydropyridine-2-carboxylate N-succinyltransferase
MAVGIGTKTKDNNWLEVYYPMPILNPSIDVIKSIEKLLKIKEGGNISIELNSKNCHALEDLFVDMNHEGLSKIMLTLEESRCPRVLTILYKDTPPQNPAEAYLKLHLLSHRFAKPNNINLDGIFNVLPTVAWTSQGPIDPQDLPFKRLDFRQKGISLNVYSIDKFPKMADYVVPSDIRIADTSRVRLGAYIGKGTTIMHEGFVNFNAGTAGPSMIEGRVSAGVAVGKGSDLGGGCSTLGTLSGGNDVIISIGENCLIGSNAGVGISLGNNCTVEAGLYLTRASKVTLVDDIANELAGTVVKAHSLANKKNLLFRRNSISGKIECLIKKNTVTLNKDLHDNN